jgi:non-heme chloroperoxidase
MGPNRPAVWEDAPTAFRGEVVDALRDGTANHRSQFYLDITIPLYGFNRPGTNVFEGIKETCGPWA